MLSKFNKLRWLYFWNEKPPFSMHLKIMLWHNWIVLCFPQQHLLMGLPIDAGFHSAGGPIIELINLIRLFFYTRERNCWKLKGHSITKKLDSLFNFLVFVSCLSLTAMVQAPKTKTSKIFLVLHLDRWMNLSKMQPPKSQTEDLNSSKYIYLMCTQHTQQNIHCVTFNTLHFF